MRLILGNGAAPGKFTSGDVFTINAILTSIGSGIFLASGCMTTMLPGRRITEPPRVPFRDKRKLPSKTRTLMNLSMLGFFKYGNFLLQNFQWLLARGGIIYQPPHLTAKRRSCREGE